jgi:peptidoglycan/xylan/chitin deacetylase (PgdA/CDA1 family)
MEENRMQTYQGPRPPIKLPGDARICVSVTIAFEAFMYHGHYGHASAKPGKPNHFSLSYAEYGPKVGFWRILDSLKRHKLAATFDVGGLAAERHPNIMRAMRDNGHEAAGHGWANDVHTSDDDPEGELKSIRQTSQAIEVGYGEKPVGWVSPGSVGSARTMQYMVDEGFLWNGDDASDDLPFVRNIGAKPLVILPRINFPTNDLIIWQKPQNPPSAYYEGFKETFDFLYEEGRRGSPKWIDLLLHCDLGGRPTLMPIFERAIQYAQAKEGVWFARRRDLAQLVMDIEGPQAKR